MLHQGMSTYRTRDEFDLQTSAFSVAWLFFFFLDSTQQWPQLNDRYRPLWNNTPYLWLQPRDHLHGTGNLNLQKHTSKDKIQSHHSSNVTCSARSQNSHLWIIHIFSSTNPTRTTLRTSRISFSTTAFPRKKKKNSFASLKSRNHQEKKKFKTLILALKKKEKGTYCPGILSGRMLLRQDML